MGPTSPATSGSCGPASTRAPASCPRNSSACAHPHDEKLRAGRMPARTLTNAKRSVHVDGDLLRLRVFTLRQPYRQHPVLVGRLDSTGVDCRRKGEGPREAAVVTLLPVEALLRDRVLQFPLTGERQHVLV